MESSVEVILIAIAKESGNHIVKWMKDRFAEDIK